MWTFPQDPHVPTRYLAAVSSVAQDPYVPTEYLGAVSSMAACDEMYGSMGAENSGLATAAGALPAAM